MNKVLIAYATWTGATRSVAEAVAEELGAAGLEVEVCRAKEVKDLSPYQAVVLGISVHMGRLPGEISSFVKRHRQALSSMPVAYFVVCLTMAEDTPENRQQTLAYLDPLRKAAPEVEPVDIGLFAGAVLDDTAEFNRLFFFFKFIARTIPKTWKTTATGRPSAPGPRACAPPWRAHDSGGLLVRNKTVQVLYLDDDTYMVL